MRVTGTAEGWAIRSDATGGNGGSLDVPAGEARTIALVFSLGTSSVDRGDFVLAAPSRFVSGEAFAATNTMDSDCVFGVTAVG